MIERCSEFEEFSPRVRGSVDLRPHGFSIVIELDYLRLQRRSIVSGYRPSRTRMMDIGGVFNIYETARRTKVALITSRISKRKRKASFL